MPSWLPEVRSPKAFISKDRKAKTAPISIAVDGPPPLSNRQERSLTLIKVDFQRKRLLYQLPEAVSPAVYRMRQPASSVSLYPALSSVVPW